MKRSASVFLEMPLSRRVFLSNAAGLSVLPWLANDAFGQISAHPPEKELPPVSPDEPVEGPRFLKCGPMVGHVSHKHALIWIKASNACKATLRFAEDLHMNGARECEPIALTAPTAYSGVFTLRDLKPEVRYFYQVLLDDVAVTPAPNPSFRCAPAVAARGKQRIAFVSCVGKRGYMSAAAWGEMAARRDFDILLMLGDNHYADTADPIGQRAHYTMHRSVGGFRELTARIPCVGIWDDHDYGPNNSDGTLENKELSLRTFREFWPNAGFGELDNPGCYHRFSRGDVDFFMLDVRYHRSPNKAPKDDPAKEFLGSKQLDWFKREIRASEARIKLIAAGSEFQSNGTEDSFAMFPNERRAFLDFLRAEGGDGVIFLSGDRHFTAGYQVEGRWIEVTSGPLGSGNAIAKVTPETWLGCSIGKMWSVFEVDTSGETPKVAYELWLAGAGLAERREFTWDEVNGRARIAQSPPLPKGVERRVRTAP